MPQSPNPFTPLAGSRPPCLAGRETLLGFATAPDAGPAPSGWILEGLRGSGKTALLQALAASAAGQAATVTAHPGRPLAQLLIPALRSLLYGLQPQPARMRALALLAGLRLAHAPAWPATAADPAPLPGHGDSGDLEADLSAALSALASAAAAQGVAMTLLLDDAHAVDRAELSAFLRACAATRPAPGAPRFVLAGLPWLQGLSEPNRILVERRFQCADLGPLTQAAAIEAVQAPAQALGKAWEADALAELWKACKGHPALLQAWAYHAWERARGAKLSAAAVRQAGPAALQALDQRFYGPGFERLSPRERGYLRSMAHLGPGPHRSSDVADSMDAKITALGPLRAKLIKEGWIHCPGHGTLAFTAPGMDEFLRRAMPNFR